jgi:hypothetical protein
MVSNHSEKISITSMQNAKELKRGKTSTAFRVLYRDGQLQRFGIASIFN